MNMNRRQLRSHARCFLSVLAITGLCCVPGCRRANHTPVPKVAEAPAVMFRPQEMADALHAVIAANHDIHSRFLLQHQPSDGTVSPVALPMANHAMLLRKAAESIQQNGAEFHYILRSFWPINPKNAPETETEKSGLRFVEENPGKNFYSDESLGGRRYFTAVYPVTASHAACAECHNSFPGSTRRHFKEGEVMGGLIVRVPLEF